MEEEDRVIWRGGGVGEGWVESRNEETQRREEAEWPVEFHFERSAANRGPGLASIQPDTKFVYTRQRGRTSRTEIARPRFCLSPSIIVHVTSRGTNLSAILNAPSTPDRGATELGPLVFQPSARFTIRSNWITRETRARTHSVIVD